MIPDSHNLVPTLSFRYGYPEILDREITPQLAEYVADRPGGNDMVSNPQEILTLRRRFRDSGNARRDGQTEKTYLLNNGLSERHFKATISSATLRWGCPTLGDIGETIDLCPLFRPDDTELTLFADDRMQTLRVNSEGVVKAVSFMSQFLALPGNIRGFEDFIFSTAPGLKNEFVPHTDFLDLDGKTLKSVLAMLDGRFFTQKCSIAERWSEGGLSESSIPNKDRQFKDNPAYIRTRISGDCFVTHTFNPAKFTLVTAFTTPIWRGGTKQFVTLAEHFSFSACQSRLTGNGLSIEWSEA